MAPPPPELMEEIVEEILLRFPPDDPERLARAALVSKLWCRLVCAAAFRRRFREFHFHRGAAPPLLGVLYGDYCDVRRGHRPKKKTDPDRRVKLVRIRESPIAYFVPTTSFRPAHAAAGQYGWRAVDARHGRVLLYLDDRTSCDPGDLCVWDPIADEQRHLPDPPFHLYTWAAAVVCAATATGSNVCNHLDCRQGPFLVVIMDIEYDTMHLSVYSSESRAWSKVTLCDVPTTNSLSYFRDLTGGVLVRSALYFLVRLNEQIVNHEIVKYDLATRQVSTIQLPSEIRCLKQSIVLMTDDDGELGFLSNAMMYKLELWSRVVTGPDDADVGFVRRRVIDLGKVLPSGALIKKKKPNVNGFADGGGGSRFLFIRTPDDGLYSIELNSSQVKKLDNSCGHGDVVPYISFCTPTSSRVQH